MDNPVTAMKVYDIKIKLVGQIVSMSYPANFTGANADPIEIDGHFNQSQHDIRALLEDSDAIRLHFRDHAPAYRAPDSTLLGKKLGDMLFNPRLIHKLFHCLRQMPRDATLRVLLDVKPDQDDVYSLPWELMQLSVQGHPDIWFGTHKKITLLRGTWGEAESIALRYGEKLRIALLVSASEGVNAQLGEVRWTEVHDHLKTLAAKHSGLIEAVEVFEDITTKKISTKVAEFAPHIIHFIGHAKTDEEGSHIALVNPEVRLKPPSWVSAATFAEALKYAKQHVPIVILQACQSGATTSQTANGTQVIGGIADYLLWKYRFPHVIAMQYAIRNGVATEFAKQIYTQLIEQKRPIDQAVQVSRREILDKDMMSMGEPGRMEGQATTPMLFSRNRRFELFEDSKPEIDQEAVLNSLCELNYKQQDRVFRPFVRLKPRVGAFFISGKPRYGQAWLMKRFYLTHSLADTSQKFVPIKLDTAIVENGMRRIWLNMIKKFSGSEPSLDTIAHDSIHEAIIENWQTTHITFAFFGTQYLTNEDIHTLITDFWQPLATKALLKPSKKHMLLFLIDHDVPRDPHPPFVANVQNGWQASQPVMLPQLRQRFESELLEEWLYDVTEEGHPLEHIVKAQGDTPEILAEQLIRDTDGIPEGVLDTICAWFDTGQGGHETWLRMG